LNHVKAMLSIELSDEQHTLKFDAPRIQRLAESILRDAGVRGGALSIAVVDDPTIHELNRRFLQHDYPTDALSFLLEREGDRLEAEVIVSADTAARVAAEVGWPADDELLLYVVHATLHLVGCDDATDELRAAMREQEKQYLARLGVERRDDP
jgi:probable rRNA maturation factor